jgi:hypothetical protein
MCAGVGLHGSAIEALSAAVKAWSMTELEAVYEAKRWAVRPLQQRIAADGAGQMRD